MEFLKKKVELLAKLMKSPRRNFGVCLVEFSQKISEVIFAEISKEPLEQFLEEFHEKLLEELRKIF